MLRNRLIVLLCAIALTACTLPFLSPDDEPVPTVRAQAARTATTRVSPAPTAQINCSRTLLGGKYPNIPRLRISDLYRCRPEARTTIEAIKRNGPFKYDQDDTVFNNREGILPPLSRGSYHEYTVVTPNASTRGTRRILSAGDPKRRPSKYTYLYYTDDHYDTAWLVVER